MNVVVAHPSPEVRRELRTPLEAFGYGVFEVANPNEALERCRAVRPEVVLVHEDVAMTSGAHSLVDELKGDPGDLRVLAGGESELRLTISVGWATWDGEESPEMLIRRADLALYEAKDAGRNKVRGSHNLSARLRRRI